MPIPAAAAAALALLGVGAAKVAGGAINKRIQKKNIAKNKPQGALSEAAFGKQPGRINPEDKLNGSNGVQQFQNYTPEQMQLMSLLGGIGQKGVEDLTLQQKNSFAPIAQQAREQFQQQTVPSIAERFTQMGGGQRSSAFGQQLGAAGANLETNLAALGAKHGLAQQGLQQNLYTNLLSLGLKPQFENAFVGGNQQSQGGALNNFNPSFDTLKGLFDAWNQRKSGDTNQENPLQAPANAEITTPEDFIEVQPEPIQAAQPTQEENKSKLKGILKKLGWA